MKFFETTILLSLIIYSGNTVTATQKLSKRLLENHKNTISSSPQIKIDSDAIVMARVEALPEYKHILKWYEKKNKDKSRHITLLVAKHPGADFKYYAVSVGEDTDSGFVTIVDFYIDPKDLSVSYYDPVTDSVLTLDEWRKNRSKEWPN